MAAATSSPGAGTGGGDLAIDLADVAKVYRGGVHALRGISMRVHRGEIFGLLGPNGAGKSTLVKILMTVIRPTRCEGRMLGRPIGDKSALRSVGYLPEHHRFPEYLTARQVVDFFGAMADIPRADRKRRTGELLELVGLTAWADKRVKSFSKGMRQRLGIAQALVNDPDLVLLDEPTDGVDPVGRRDIRAICAELKRRGKTVFLNSHLLSELEMVCDRVAILVQGVVSNQGTLEELTRDSRRYEILVRGEAPGWAADGSVRVSAENGTARIVVSGSDPESVQPIIDRLREEGRIIIAVTPVRESLEDLFMRAVTDPRTGAALAPGAVGGAA